MKRSQDIKNHHSNNPKKIKRETNIQLIIQNFKTLDNDSIGQIFNYLPIKILCKFRLVNRDWKEIIDSGGVNLFSPVRNMMKYCDEYFVERNDDLFCAIFGWLTGKVRSKDLSLKKPEIFIDSHDPLIVGNYPCVTVISSTDGWLKEVAHYELMIHIKEGVQIRMFMQLSLLEEEMVYVNIDKNEDDLFDWNLLNIDPNFKKILVHQVNDIVGNFDNRVVSHYQHNSQFFNYLANLFGLKTTHFYLDLFEILFQTNMKWFKGNPTEISKSQQCKKATISKYSDQLREKLIVKPLEKIQKNEMTHVIEIMQNVVSNIYSSCLHTQVNDKVDEFRVFNVKGDAYEIPFHLDMHYIVANFQMSLNDRCYDGSIHIERSYCGIVDGDIISSCHSFSIIDLKSKSNFKFLGNVEIDSVEWKKRDCEQTFQRIQGFREEFDSFDNFLEVILDAILEKLPLLDPFKCIGSVNVNTLKQFILGDVREIE